MKSLFTLLVLFQIAITPYNQKSDAPEAIVEEVKGIPIFMYSEPIESYEILGKAMTFKEIISIATLDKTSVHEKAEKIVDMVLQKKENGDIPDFDAIIIDIIDDKTHVIKFNENKSLRAKVKNVKDVPLYFLSKPATNYTVVDSLNADFSLYAKRNLLYDKINSMVKRTIKKSEKEEIGKFDAMIFDSNNLSAVTIRFTTD